jgi:hypothetical protein
VSYNRLDDRSISDVVLRSLFHQEVIKRSASFHEDNHDYTIRLDEIYRADLAAYRAYEGNSDLRWVFRLLCGIESEMEPMPAGQTISLPDMAWLRGRIRDFAGDKPELISG